MIRDFHNVAQICWRTGAKHLNLPKILVTGAAGFIGGRVVDGLHRAGAVDIRAGIARRGQEQRFAQLPVEIVQCNVTDAHSLDAATKGVDVVVHCAHSRFDQELTVKGTSLLLDRAAANGVSKMIHMSSAAVYGDARGIVDEDTAPMSPVSVFGQQKTSAEQYCRAAAGPRMAVAVLRPTLVYGPNSELWTTLYIKRILAGQLRQLGAAGEGKANLLYIDDLVRLVAHLVRTRIPEYSIFNVNGAEVPTFNRYFDCLRSALQSGSVGESVHPPSAVASSGLQAMLRGSIKGAGKRLAQRHPNVLSAARNTPVLARLIRRAEDDLRLRPNDGELELYGIDVTYSASRAKAIGFEPKVSLAEGVAASVAWAKTVGLVDQPPKNV